MREVYFTYYFKGYPSKDENGKVGIFDGGAKIKCRPNPDYRDNWTVDGVDAQKQGNCAKLPETAWNIQDLERWLRNAHQYKHKREIDAQAAAAEAAEGR